MRSLSLLLVVLAGCDTTALERSCGGSVVDLCAPREWAEVREATLRPEGLSIADFSVRAQLHVTLDRCEDAPAPHAVDVLLRAGGEGDGGSSVRVMSLLTVEDGADGDAVAGDGVIDVEVVNPFLATVPADEDVTLRFVARSTTPRGCTSEWPTA